MKATTTLVALSLGAVVAGCAVGPDFERPALPADAGYAKDAASAPTASANTHAGEAQRFVPGADVPGRWWTLFGSPELDALVDEAISRNPNVQAAQAALRAAHEGELAQRGAFLPSVQAGYSPSRQKVADPLSSPLASGALVFDLHTAQVSVSYLPDIFGLNRRQVEGLAAQADAQRFELEATYLALTANVVSTAVQEASLREQIAQTEEIVRVETEQLGLIRRQLDLGAVAEAAVVAQEATVAQTSATLPVLRKQLEQQRSALAALTGRFPADPPAARFDLTHLRLPQEIPVSLPSTVVEQRPDVRAAEAQLHAASAQIGVATASMLPQVTLTGNAGNTSTQLAELFTSSNAFWSIAANIVQPVFQGGTLLHRKRQAEAIFDQAAAQYRAAVLTAFQNVNDSLKALQFDAESLKAAAAAETATATSLEIARKQLELGDISYLALLSSNQAYRQAVINRIQAQASRLSDTAALFQALGGGWWNRSQATTATR